MAKKDSTIKNGIELVGEKEYRDKLTQINRALRESKSAMKAAAAEYDAAGGSQQALTQQGDALEKTIRSQEEALQLMSEHLVKVEKHYGQNSREASRLRTQINNMRTELAKSQTQLKEFEQGLNNSADAGNDLENQLGGADNALAQVGEAASDAAQEVDELSQGIAGAVGDKLISFKIADKALEGLKEGIAFAIGEAVQGSVENGLMHALTGDEELSEARNAVKDVIDRTWAGRVDGEETTGIVASADTALGNVAESDPELLTWVSNAAILQQEVFGGSAAQQIEYAKHVVNAYGTEWGTVFDLMTKGYQDSSDGGTLMNSVLDKSVNLFEQMGYDADDMFAVVLSAVNDEALGKDSNLNNGMTALVGNVRDGSEALKTLGFETTDLSYKAQQDGATAARAYQDVLQALLSIEDVDLRNALGAELFGETVWTATGGGIAEALLAGFGQTLEADGSTQAAMDALLDNLGDNLAGLKERAGQAMGEITEPIAEGANNAIKALNEGIDNGEILSGVGNAVLAWGDGLHAALDPKLAGVLTDVVDSNFTGFKAEVDEQTARLGGDALAGYSQATANRIEEGLTVIKETASAKLEQLMPDISTEISKSFYTGAQDGTDDAEADATAQRWVDVLRGSVDSAAAETEQSDAISGMLDGMLPGEEDYGPQLKTYAESHKAAIVAQMETAYGENADEDFLAWQAFQQAMIDSAYEGNVEQAGVLGEDTAKATTDAIGEAEPDAQRAGNDYGEAIVSGVADMTGEADRAGEEIGLSAEEGFISGTDGMYGDGQDAARGAIQGAKSQTSAMYSAGESLGGAFRSGFRATMRINSPSRAAMEDMGYVVDGYVMQAQEERRRLSDAAAGLGEALRGGVSHSAMGGADALSGPMSGSGGVTAEEIGSAVAQAISGMVLGMDARKAGDMLELYVSQAERRRAAGTVSGASTAVKGW